MSKKVLWIAIALVLVGLVSWGAYKGGYSWGLCNGYKDGYEAGYSSFPRLDIEDVTFTQDGNTISFSQMTITGEQHIIDTIKNLPNMESIVSIKSSKPDWEK